jgi:hypothetical protein
LRRGKDLHLANVRAKPAVDAILPGEPEHAFAVEDGRVEVGVPAPNRQRENDDLARPGIDTYDGIKTTIGDPRGAIRADDHAVRRRSIAKRDVLCPSSGRVETS